MEQFGSTVKPFKCPRVHLLVVASCLPLRDGCTKDLPRTSDDICNVNASGSGDTGYNTDKRCVILFYIKEESENKLLQFAAWVVGTDASEEVRTVRRRSPFVDPGAGLLLGDPWTAWILGKVTLNGLNGISFSGNLKYFRISTIPAHLRAVPVSILIARGA